MSSPKLRNQSIEGIAKTEKEPERCGIGRVSKLPTHTRSPSASDQKSKIPTNVNHVGRSGAVIQSQVQDNSRLLTSVASDEATIDKNSPINSGRRPTSKSATVSSNPSTTLNTPKAKSLMTSGGISSMLKRQFESQFTIKRKRYAMLKKELMDKQKNATDLYEEMSHLREKLLSCGARDPGKIETINLTSIPSQQYAAQFIVDSHAFRGSGEQVFSQNSAVTNEIVSTLETKLRQVPDRCFDFSRELLQKRLEIFQRLVEFEGKSNEAKIDSDIAQQFEIYHKESSELETRLDEKKKVEEEFIDETIQKISSIWNELQVSRVKIQEFTSASEEMIKELNVKLDAASKEKIIESEKYEELRVRKQALDNDLQKFKTKFRAMEIRAHDDETKINQLQSNVKNLELQLKQKESSNEQRFKEMQKSLKNSENLLVKTEKQRDNFESRLNEMKKNLGSKETEAEKKIKELSEKLIAVNTEFDKYLEKHKNEMGQTFCDESEVETRLAERDEKIAMLQREKEDIIRVMHHGLLSEGSGFKLDGDSNSHEMIVSALMKKMQEIRMNIKLTQDKNENLQKQLSELRLRMQTQSKESGGSGKSIWASQVIELQQQVCDLRCSVAELTGRNEELEIQLNQKQLEIEEQDRAMREQSTVLKVRDEVIGLLKGRPDARTNFEGGHLSLTKKKNLRDREQVDKQIAEKTENLQQLYSTLETKQMQITRLEQLVKQMEIQQDRAQEQRTRLEKKIAQLQLAMHYRSKSHRYVKMENPVSSVKLCSAVLRDSSDNQQALQHPSMSSKKMENSVCRQPRSCSRPPSSQSPPRQLKIQRSKTLNSIQVKSRTMPSKEYDTQVINEVARTLRHERAYDYEKRGLREERQYSREDRGAVGNVLDAPGISKEEIHESFYNWLVEPWIFEGVPSNLGHSSSPLCQNHWPRGYTASSEISINAIKDDLMPRRHRATNDCSRESRCGSPGCRRQSVTDWNCSASPTRVRTCPQENIASRSRRQRS